MTTRQFSLLLKKVSKFTRSASPYSLHVYLYYNFEDHRPFYNLFSGNDYRVYTSDDIIFVEEFTSFVDEYTLFHVLLNRLYFLRRFDEAAYLETKFGPAYK